MTAAFAEIGITPRDYCVLAHAMSGEYTQIELAKLSDLDKTTMLNTLDELEQAATRSAGRRPRTAGSGSSRSPRPAPAWSPLVTRSPTGCTARCSTRCRPEERQAFTGALTRLVTGLLAEPVECDRPVRRARVPS